MIANVPPFYVRFLKSVFSPEEPRKQATTKAPNIEPEPIALVPVREPKRIEDATTSLKALPAPQQPQQDILSLPNRDHLRRVVRDEDQVLREGRDGVDDRYEEADGDDYPRPWCDPPRRRIGFISTRLRDR
jgi:hypothetical protein